jgi:hypothetical protein
MNLLRLAATACLAALGPAAAAAPPAPTFEGDVLPILRSACVSCHGGVTKKNGLDLRTRDSVLQGGKAGPAVVPGKPDESPLWKKVAAGEMPKEGEKLTAAEAGTLKAWIAAGAPAVARDDTAAPAKPGDPAAVAAAVDKAIAARLADQKLEPYPPADDAAFVRRAFLDLTGRVPPADRAAAFLDDKSPDKRAELIDELLASPGYGRHQAAVWHDLLMPLDNNRRVLVADFRHWLADGFDAGRGWDKTVTTLLTATGRYGESPATAFFSAHAEPKDAAVKAARLFLGVRLECAECHDHPYARWSQENHWGLVAFFSRARGSKNGGVLDRKVAFSAVTEDVPAGGGSLNAYKALPPRGALKIPVDAATNVGKVVRPRFLDGTVPELGDDPPYRPALAAWVTDPKNAAFARATANRVWWQCFGRGLVDPVDDLDERNRPAYPEVLARLAREFVASGYDYRHLFRCVCLTDAYRRTSVARRNDDAAARLFARQSPKVLGPEPILDSLALAAGEAPFAAPRLADFLPKTPPPADPKKASPFEGAAVKQLNAMRPRNEAINQLLAPAAADPTEYRLGLLQALRLMNGGPFDGGPALAARLAKEAGAPAAVVERLYLGSLSRRPTADESRRMTDYVTRQPSHGAGYAGVLWVLCNSAEFVTVP